MSAELWVLAAGGIPCAARRDMPCDTRPVSWWLSVCILGQHLPQIYRDAEIHQLGSPSEAEALGLCPDCLGFGTSAELDLMWPYRIDQVPDPCRTCGGTGRPCLRVRIHKNPGSISVSQEISRHPFIGAPYEISGIIQGCLGCGEGPLHQYHENL